MSALPTISLLILLSHSSLAAELSGTLLTEDGIAVANAQITAYNSSLRSWNTMSDSEGYFSLSGLPAGSYRALIVPAYSDNLLATFITDSDEPMLDICSSSAINLEPTGEVEIQQSLSAGLIVTGQIQDAASNGLEDVECWLEGHESHEGLSIPRGALSDEQGHFVIAGVPSNQALQFRFSSDEIPEQYDGGELAVTDDALSAEQWFSQDTVLPTPFQLLSGVHIEGLIYSGSLAISNADVTVYSGGQITRTTSNQNGVYSVIGLPAGDALAWATAPGWATTYSPNTDRPQSFLQVGPDGAGTTELHIEMPKESTLRISLTDSNSGLGISGASLLLYNDNRTVGRGLPVDAEGVALFEGLHPGTCSPRIFAENDGYLGNVDQRNRRRQQLSPTRDTQSIEIALSLNEQLEPSRSPLTAH